MTSPNLSESGLARLRDVVSAHVERGSVPGVTYAVSRRGERLVEAVGASAYERPHAVSPETIFRISSMSKPVTAVATLILLEECVLRLDDPVEEFLPELADRRVVKRIDGPTDETEPANRPITVRDLLTFRMGFGAYFGPSPVNEAARSLDLAVGPPEPGLAPEPDEWMRRFSTLPLMCHPGERWLYHTGADILGVLVARASGRTFPAFLAERIFEPLGMKDTAFWVGPDKQGRMATSYLTNLETGLPELFDEPDGHWGRPPAFPGGGAGLVSTVTDYMSFAEMLLRGGAPILSRPSVETMTTDQLTAQQKKISGFFPDDFDAKGFGFCVGVVTRRESPSAPVGQYGWDGGLGSIWRNDPAEQMALVLLSNVAWSSPRPPAIARDFLTAAYAAIDD